MSKRFSLFKDRKSFCLKKCDVLSFLNKSCIAGYLIENNQINNINNVKKAIEDHSIIIF